MAFSRLMNKRQKSRSAEGKELKCNWSLNKERARSLKDSCNKAIKVVSYNPVGRRSDVQDS